MSIVKLRRAKKCIMLFVLCTYVLVVNTHLIQVKKKHHLCLHTGLKSDVTRDGIIFFKCPNKVLAPKGIHPKYYKHLKKVLNKAIWVDKPWTGF